MEQGAELEMGHGIEGNRLKIIRELWAWELWPGAVGLGAVA